LAIVGAVWANEARVPTSSWDPAGNLGVGITLSGCILHARITRGWQGRRPAILATTGLQVVWICYLGVNLLGKGLHFPWLVLN